MIGLHAVTNRGRQKPERNYYLKEAVRNYIPERNGKGKLPPVTAVLMKGKELEGES